MKSKSFETLSLVSENFMVFLSIRELFFAFSGLP